MASLAQVTRETRLIAKIGSALLVVLVIIFFATNGIGFIKNTFFPKPPPPPQMSFGQLPPLSSAIKGSPPTQYIVNTVSGNLPQIGTDRLIVYKIKKPVASITALTTMQNNIQTLSPSFSNQIKLSDTLYQWSDLLGRVLRYDILTNNFDITSSYIQNAAAFPPGQLPPDVDSVTGVVKGFLQSITTNTGDDLSDVMSFQNQTVTYYTINNGQLIPTEKSTDAQVVRLDVFQNDVPVDPFIFGQSEEKTLKMYYPTPQQSTMNFFLAFDPINNLTIEEAHFIHQAIDTNTHSTYPVKTVDQAFKDLQAGKGIITNNSQETTINVTGADIGYYLGPNQDYLYPVYIFSGKDFTAYIPALSDSSFQ